MKDGYCLENGLYVFYRDGEKLSSSKSISVVLDLEMGCLLKHGSTERIEPYYQESLRKLRESYKDGVVLEMQTKFNLPVRTGKEIAMDLKMITSENWDVEELNKILDITGYAGKYYLKIYGNGEAKSDNN